MLCLRAESVLFAENTMLLHLQGENTSMPDTLRVASLYVGLCADCPSVVWVVCYIPLLFHDDVMTLFAITFSGGNDIVFVSPYSRAESPKALSSGQSVSVAPS